MSLARTSPAFAALSGFALFQTLAGFGFNVEAAAAAGPDPLLTARRREDFDRGRWWVGRGGTKKSEPFSLLGPQMNIHVCVCALLRTADPSIAKLIAAFERGVGSGGYPHMHRVSAGLFVGDEQVCLYNSNWV